MARMKRYEVPTESRQTLFSDWHKSKPIVVYAINPGSAQNKIDKLLRGKPDAYWDYNRIFINDMEEVGGTK